jgi:hypothetical protein
MMPISFRPESTFCVAVWPDRFFSLARSVVPVLSHVGALAMVKSLFSLQVDHSLRAKVDN